MRYMIFQYGLVPVLIQRILMGFVAILEIILILTYSVNVKSKLTKRGYGRTYLSCLCSSCAPRLFYYLGSVIVDINFTTLFIVENSVAVYSFTLFVRLSVENVYLLHRIIDRIVNRKSLRLKLVLLL